jgi:hypothetical protein
VQKHVFNFFTTCAIRFGLKLRDKAAGDRRRFEAYAKDTHELDGFHRRPSIKRLSPDFFREFCSNYPG